MSSELTAPRPGLLSWLTSSPKTSASWADWARDAHQRHGGPARFWRMIGWIATDPDYHFRRAIRIAGLIGFLVAGLFYAVKAAEDRSAFLRWRDQVLQLDQGVNIYDEMLFPTPPIMPLMLFPLMKLPPLAGALAWFVLKSALAIGAFAMVLRMAARAGQKIPAWVEGAILFLSCRPILSDLHHGNNNLLILFLVVAACDLWTRKKDISAGLVLALAITCKVTPALFGVYFLYKRSWKLVAACAVGGILFLFVVPSIFLGPSFNWELLTTWWHRIIRPYVASGVVGDQEVNQSMVGVLTRLLTENASMGPRYGAKLGVNLLSLDRGLVATALKGISFGLIGLLAWLCRTKSDRRNDPRWLGEFALVVLTMLFVSERSWKHHYVTLLLPFAYLGVRCAAGANPLGARWAIGASLIASATLIGLTSPEFGLLLGLVAALGTSALAAAVFARRYLDPEHGPQPPPRFGTLAAVAASWFVLIWAPLATLSVAAWGWMEEHHTHEFANGYGTYFWAGVLAFIATAWCVRRERLAEPAPKASTPNPVYHPHLAVTSSSLVGETRTALIAESKQGG